MQLASGCMWIWFADSIPALVGFLQALRFLPTPKNRNPFIFLVNSFWSLVVCIKPACLPEVWLPMCTLWLSHSGALRTQWVDMSRVTKTANYYYYYYPSRATSRGGSYLTKGVVLGGWLLVALPVETQAGIACREVKNCIVEHVKYSRLNSFEYCAG